MGPRDILYLSKEHWKQMLAEVQRNAPEEACGLLAGKQGTVDEVFPLENALHSPVAYRLDPKEQWEAFQKMEAGGLDLVGIYHSHPSGPEHPSATDIAEAYYPEAVYLIWSRSSGDWQCKGFWIQDRKVRGITLQIFE